MDISTVENWASNFYVSLVEHDDYVTPHVLIYVHIDHNY